MLAMWTSRDVDVAFVMFDLLAGHCCDFVSILVDEEEVVAAVGESVSEFDEHVLWGRVRLVLVFVMVLCQPVVPNGRFGTVFAGDCAHMCFVWMEGVRRTGAVARLVRPGVAVDHGWCSWADR